MQPKRYRKRPVVVEAVQVDASNYDGMCEIIAWCSGRPVDFDGHVIAIDTLEGEMHADPGDWIIRGIAGEFYPCKPDIFAASYDRVPAEPSTPRAGVLGPEALASLRWHSRKFRWHPTREDVWHLLDTIDALIESQP